MSLIMGLITYSNAQSYQFSKTTGTYTNLTGATSLTNNLTWDDPIATIPLGFNITLFDTTVSTLYFNESFWGGTIMASNLDVGRAAAISIFEADLMDRGYDYLMGEDQPGGLSTLSYKVDGTSGNKVAKIEWKNVGFYEEILNDDTSLQFMNCQLWLYEGSNTIEMHYGPNNVTNGPLVYENEPGPSIGIFPAVNMETFLFEGDGFAVGGIVPNELGYINFSDTTPYLGGTPANGTIYKFTFDPTSVKDVNKLAKEIKLWPQPAANLVNLQSSLTIEPNVTALAVDGRKIALKLNQNKVDISTLPKGIYTLQFEVNRQLVNKRLSVQ